MSIISLARKSGIATPDELALLQRAFNEACRRNGYTPGEKEAEVLAVDIISRFMMGATDEAALLDTVAQESDSRCA